MAESGPLTGSTLGEYVIGNLLDEGAFGQVYEATHPKLGRRAIKVLRGVQFRSAKVRKRFLREIRTQTSLVHPHIMRLNDAGREGNLLYLVMPLAAGGTLKYLLEGRTEPLPLEQVMIYLEEIASALDYAHSQGVVHLDVKPANLLVDEFGHLLLSDFGLARIVQAGVLQGSSSLMIGPLSYTAPERMDDKAEARSDLYSLGIILYEMLSGRLPFQGDTPEAIINQHLYAPVPSVCQYRPDLPPELDEVLNKALKKDPNERYQTGAELVAAFRDACFPLLKEPFYYPEHVLRAINACYLRWRNEGDLGAPEAVDQHTAQVLHSQRGTRGYCYPFTSGAIYWTEHGGAQPIWGQIFSLFDLLGGVGGKLGFPLTHEIATGPSPRRTTGVLQRFEGPGGDYPEDVAAPPVRYGATVYFSNRYGPQPTWGSIGACYERLGGASPHNPLGFPTAPPMQAAASPRGTKGVYQRFESGNIHCARDGEAIPVLGEIERLYKSLGGSRGPLGFPLTPQFPALASPFDTTGLVQRFEGMREYPEDIPALEIRCGASIYWSEQYGAYSVLGGIGALYERLQGTSGVLGFPISKELRAASSPYKTEGRYQCFEGGIIYFSAKYGAIPVMEPILNVFKSEGETGGSLGFPKSAREERATGEVRQAFEGGFILVIRSSKQ